jgi:hypothetical protein
MPAGKIETSTISNVTAIYYDIATVRFYDGNYLGFLVSVELRIFWNILNHNHSIILYGKYDKQNPLKRFNLCP